MRAMATLIYDGREYEFEPAALAVIYGAVVAGEEWVTFAGHDKVPSVTIHIGRDIPMVFMGMASVEETLEALGVPDDEDV